LDLKTRTNLKLSNSKRFCFSFPINEMHIEMLNISDLQLIYFAQICEER